jgi:hypothetical protein
MKRFAGLAIGAFLSLSVVHAGVIGLGGFSGSATLINFDGLTGGASLGSGDVVTNQYAGLGVTFGNATATANTFLATLLPAASLPNAVFVFQGGGGSLPPLSMFFSVPVNRVGLDFGLSTDSFLTMAAYDASNTLLETLNYVGASVPGVGLAGFAGIEESASIARLDVSYHPNSNPSQTFNYVFDNLRFEAANSNGSATPEPAAAVLMGAGLAMIAVLRKRTRREPPSAA